MNWMDRFDWSDYRAKHNLETDKSAGGRRIMATTSKIDLSRIQNSLQVLSRVVEMSLMHNERNAHFEQSLLDTSPYFDGGWFEEC